MTITDDDLDRICAEWRERRCVTFDKVMAQKLRDIEAKVTAIFRFDETAEPNPNEAAQVIVAAEGAQTAPLLIVVYVYAHALRHWQVSMAHWPVDLLDKVCRLMPHVNDHEGEVFRAFHKYVVWLKSGYQAENGLNCSCPTQTREAGRNVREMAAAFKDTLEGIPVSDGDVAQIMRILKLDVNVHLDYFEAIERVAAAVKGLIDGTMDSAQLDDTIGDVRYALAALKGDSHQSNLRPHLAMLEASKGGQAKDQLRIESARLRYCYPFAMLKKEDANQTPGRRRHSLFAISKIEGNQQKGLYADRIPISEESVATARKSDSWPVSWVPEPQRLSDLWRDPQDATINTIDVPDVIVETSDASLTFSCELRLRQGGNHSLILTHEFKPDTSASPRGVTALGSLHLLNQAFRRATSSMGDETIRFEDGKHDTIPKLVEHVLSLIAESFGGEVVCASRGGTPLAIDDFHIVVSQIELSVESENCLRRPACPEDLGKALGGSLLTRDVRQMAATTMEEWLLEAPKALNHLCEEHCRSGELLLGNSNTTVLFTPYSPDWVILDELEEIVVFVVAQKALYRMWHRQLERREKKLSDFNKDLRGAVEHRKKPPDLVEMQSSVLDLRQLQATIGAELARVNSLNVLRSDGYRELHDALRKSASLPRLEDDLKAKLLSLSEEHQQISAMTEALVERRRNDSTAIIEFILGALAVFGILSWVRDLFDHRGWGGFSFEFAIAVVAVIALWGLHEWRRRT